MTTIPWFKIDDGFWSHPKVLELSDEAVALWVRAGSYCAGHLTDGVVKRPVLRVLGANEESAYELVDAGLWDETGDEWAFHDWSDYQPDRATVLAEREAAAERMRQIRAARKQRALERSGERSGEQDANVRDVFGRSSENVRQPRPGPTRPDPTRPLSTSNEVERTPPSPFCYQHPDGTDAPCKRCQNARLKYEATRQAEKQKPTPSITRPPECEEHPGWPLPCDKCARIKAEEQEANRGA